MQSCIHSYFAYIMCILVMHTCIAYTHTRSKEFYVKENDSIGEGKVVLP